MDGGRSKFTEEFWLVLNYLGWGDPEAVIWTVGIEEGQPWCSCKDTEDKDLEYIKWKIQNKFTKPIIPLKDECEPNFRIAGVVADILYTFYKYEYENKEDFKKFFLWKEGSKICNINIYPLGKASLSKSYPKCYERLFGLKERHLDNYFKEVKEKRYKRIRELWEKLRNRNGLITICYGISGWNEFKSTFCLENDAPEGLCKGKMLKYESKKVILCPHLSRGFSDAYKKEIRQILTEWGLQEKLAS